MDWQRCRIAVFDLDGTLYDPAPLRLHMMGKVLWGTAKGANLKLPLVIRSLRRVREQLAEAERDDFEALLFTTVAEKHGLTLSQVRTVHDHWFDEVPLPLLHRYAAPGVERCFASLRDAGILIGVLSDHKADKKLAALGLHADIVVSASDVGVQKPHSRGLETVLARAGCTPAQAVVIGDRKDRDGAIAGRVGASFLLRAPAPSGDFYRFDDPVFRPLT